MSQVDEFDQVEAAVPPGVRDELIRLADSPEGARLGSLLRSVALLNFARTALSLQLFSDDQVASRLDEELRRFTTMHRSRALKGFVLAKEGRKEILKSDEHSLSRSVAIVGELIDISDSESLSAVGKLRRNANANIAKYQSLSKDGSEYVLARRVRALLWYWAGRDDVLDDEKNVRRSRQNMIDVFAGSFCEHLRKEAESSALGAQGTPGATRGGEEMRDFLDGRQVLGGSPDEVSVGSIAQSLAGGYVRRGAYHKEFIELLNSGVECIVLAGLPGIGKTELLNGLISEHLQEVGNAPVIRFIDGRPVLEDLHTALIDLSISMPMESISQLGLATLTSGPGAPQFVAFDNLQDLREVDLLLPPQTRSRLLIACNKVNRTTRRHKVIRVDVMRQSEAVELIGRRLPQLGQDASVLADALALIHR